jgi:hypothetical protein
MGTIFVPLRWPVSTHSRVDKHMYVVLYCTTLFTFFWHWNSTHGVWCNMNCFTLKSHMTRDETLNVLWWCMLCLRPLPLFLCSSSWSPTGRFKDERFGHALTSDLWHGRLEVKKIRRLRSLMSGAFELPYSEMEAIVHKQNEKLETEWWKRYQWSWGQRGESLAILPKCRSKTCWSGVERHKE